MTDPAAFVVEATYIVRGRGPVITCSREAAPPAGTFHAGDTVVCGPLIAAVRGVEHFLVPGAPDQGLLLDIDPQLLTTGQVWRKVSGHVGHGPGGRTFVVPPGIGDAR